MVRTLALTTLLSLSAAPAFACGNAMKTDITDRLDRHGEPVPKAPRKGPAEQRTDVALLGLAGLAGLAGLTGAVVSRRSA